MLDFGFIDDWTPAPGRITGWTIAPESHAAMLAAPPHPTPPSYQQEQYLRATLRNVDAGVHASRLCMIAVELPGHPDRPALKRTVTRFLRRHDTFASWFTHEPGGAIARRTVPADTISVITRDYGLFDSGSAIRAHVHRLVPNALHWDCFGFGVIDHGTSFTIFAAIDHLHTDGVGQALTFAELLMIYGIESAGSRAELPPVGSHLHYCCRERALNAILLPESPPTRTWVRLLRQNGGEMPAMPVDLGQDKGSGFRDGAQITVPLFDERTALRFEQVCTDNGGRFLSGLFVALALTDLELAGREWYFALTPVNTRKESGESGSIGWYTNLIPIAFQLEPTDTFTSLVSTAQWVVDEAKELTDISPHRVLELAATDPAIRTRPGWAATMLSHIDVRKIPGAEILDHINGGIYGNRAASGAVYVWVNRFSDVTTLSLLFPDTPEAHASINRYVKTLTAILTTVATDGDYSVDIDTRR
ncbi:condensation domain-containing protein [Nocardia sp. NPDC056100]|uniref:condensation domain-containing protein n=1 Tax=Nocardia sp. NPDC056100 TaxID=3345712 RepID=UPI0035D5DAEB